MPQQYLSTDPNAGTGPQYLSTDPNAGNAPSSGSKYLSTDPNAGEESGVNPWLVGAGVGLAGLAAAVTHNPSLLKSIPSALNSARKTSMLSGLAVPKSILGNIGGAAMGSIERQSMAPLREMLSMKTAKDAVQSFKNGPNQAMAGPAQGLSKWNLPGRVMGAMDEAGQNALQRAGYNPKDAAAEMLQSPLPHELSDAFDRNPIMDFLVPFRKTAYNALTKGVESFKADTTGKKLALAESMGSGAVTGAEAEDPKTIGITTAAHGRYGLPHAIAAGASRAYFGGNTREAENVVNAASDFGGAGQGVVQMATHPIDTLTKTVTSPALLSLLKYFGLKD